MKATKAVIQSDFNQYGDTVGVTITVHEEDGHAHTFTTVHNARTGNVISLPEAYKLITRLAFDADGIVMGPVVWPWARRVPGSKFEVTFEPAALLCDTCLKRDRESNPVTTNDVIPGEECESCWRVTEVFGREFGGNLRSAHLNA